MVVWTNDVISHTRANVTIEWFGNTATPRKLVPSLSFGVSLADSIENPDSESNPRA
jgi:hypothetical protein